MSSFLIGKYIVLIVELVFPCYIVLILGCMLDLGCVKIDNVRRRGQFFFLLFIYLFLGWGYSCEIKRSIM